MAVMVTYKEHSWKPWKFERTPHGWWSELAAWFAAGDTYATAALREYILDIAQELQIKSMEEWHNVTPEKLRPSHSRHLDYLGRLPKVLKRLYPTYPWKFVIHEEKCMLTFNRIVILNTTHIHCTFSVGTFRRASSSTKLVE